jgi:hypothetical protein
VPTDQPHLQLLNDPWILQFDNFATREQWEWLATELNDKFEGSTVVGELDANGNVGRQTLQTRTSSNAWCNLDSCYRSKVHKQLQSNLMEILGPTVGQHHMEALQVRTPPQHTHTRTHFLAGSMRSHFTVYSHTPVLVFSTALFAQNVAFVGVHATVCFCGIVFCESERAR